jgi:hypothetical protein
MVYLGPLGPAMPVEDIITIAQVFDVHPEWDWMRPVFGLPVPEVEIYVDQLLDNVSRIVKRSVVLASKIIVGSPEDPQVVIDSECEQIYVDHLKDPIRQYHSH